MSATTRSAIVAAVIAWSVLPVAAPAGAVGDVSHFAHGPAAAVSGAGIAQPSVEATLDPGEPDGENGWHVTPVTVTLSSDDPHATFEWYLEGAGSYWVPWVWPRVFDLDRSYEIHARATGQGGTSETTTVTFGLDMTPPVTSAHLDGVLDGDVYVGEVTVTLDTFELWSGTAQTHLRRSGDASQLYEGPVTFDEPGEHVVEFRSVDRAGNVEDWRQVVFEIADTAGSGGQEPPLCERLQGRSRFPDAAGSGHRFFIDCLAELGIVGGMTDGLFHPARPVTRGQLASFVARTLQTSGNALPGGGAVTGAGMDPFVDVALTSTHGQAIAALHAAGIVQGYPDGTFRPATPVSRAHAARYVVNALEWSLGETLPTSGERFPDVVVSQSVVDIDKLVTARVVGGFVDGTFGPHRLVTRGQTSTLVGNALGVLEQRGAVGL